MIPIEAHYTDYYASYTDNNFTLITPSWDVMLSPPGDGVEGGNSGHGHPQDGHHHSVDDAQNQVAERVGHARLRYFGDLGHHGSGDKCQTGEANDVMFLSSTVRMSQDCCQR